MFLKELHKKFMFWSLHSLKCPMNSKAILTPDVTQSHSGGKGVNGASI